MSLNLIEQSCQEVLVLVQDLISAGRRGKITNTQHMELAGRIRDLLVKLKNKEFGCASGMHSGHCDCKEGRDGKHLNV